MKQVRETNFRHIEKALPNVHVQNDLPIDWTYRALGEVADLNPRLNKATVPDDMLVSFVPMHSVGAGNNQINASQLKRAGDVKKGYTPFREKDVLFAKITPCMENGKIAVVAKLNNGYGFGSTEFHVLRPKQDIDERYLYYFISREDFRREAAYHMTGAVGQKRVPAAFINECPIPVAPLELQKSIVAEIEKQFSRLDKAVASLKRAKANLKRYKASVLKAAVEGKLTEEWRKQHPDVEPASVLLKRILAERKKKWEAEHPGKKYKEPAPPDAASLPELPGGWVWVTLDSVCLQIGDVDHRMPKAKNRGIPYISTKDFLPFGEIDYENAKKIDQNDYEKLCRKIFPEKGDILLTRYGTVGEVRIVKTNTPFQASYSIAILKTITEILSDYLSRILQTEPIQKQIKKHTRATAQPDLGLEHIRLLSIPMASTMEQKKINEEIDRLFSVASVIEANIECCLKRTYRLRQSILHDAFSGKLVILSSKMQEH